MVKVQGLLDEPPEQVAPLEFQLENCQLVAGVALTEINEPTVSGQDNSGTQSQTQKQRS